MRYQIYRYLFFGVWWATGIAFVACLGFLLLEPMMPSYEDSLMTSTDDVSVTSGSSIRSEEMPDGISDSLYRD